jgi:DNA-directed RNA polymerase subunit RPC12/RpoP
MYVMSVQEVVFFAVDLFETEGRGEFKCPRCGVEISPDDTTENVYRILDVVMEEDRLDKVILECNKCGSHIHLTGFNLLVK